MTRPPEASTTSCWSSFVNAACCGSGRRSRTASDGRHSFTPSVLREKGTPFHELGLDDPALTDGQLLDAMMAHPILINRPIVVSPASRCGRWLIFVQFPIAWTRP